MHQNDRAQKVSCRSLLEAHFEPFLVQVVCSWFWRPLGRQKPRVFRAAVQDALQEVNLDTKMDGFTSNSVRIGFQVVKLMQLGALDEAQARQIAFGLSFRWSD